MSRVYVVTVSESVRRVVHLRDRVATRIDWIEVVSPEEMARLLAAELAERGFEIEGPRAHRVEPDGVRIEVELATGQVVLSLERERTYEREGEHRARSETPDDSALAKRMRRELVASLESDIERASAAEQTEVTEALERRVADVRAELDQIGNRVTAEALLAKARRMGEVKSIEGDVKTGNLRIVVEL